MATPTPEQIRYQFEHIHENRRREVVSTAVVMIVLTTSAVAFRFAVRKLRKIPLWWDDWICLMSLPFSILGAILSIANQALGYHFLALKYPQIVQYLKILYAGEIQYGIGIVLVKLAILALYRRMFPLAHVPRWWRACWWLLCVCSVLLFTPTFVGIFHQCRPIAYFWNRTIPGGHCIDLLGLILGTGITNVVLDVMILILPLPVLSKLQIGKAKKIGLIGLFLVGGL